MKVNAFVFWLRKIKSSTLLDQCLVRNIKSSTLLDQCLVRNTKSSTLSDQCLVRNAVSLIRSFILVHSCVKNPIY